MKFNLDVTSEASSDGVLAKQQRVSKKCLPLLEAANLNIYRDNPFRITGLPVDATAKEIARHADKLKQMEELGYGDKANTAAFALNPPPTIDQIREAMQRLKEPERRLIDEFFWFWPKTFGESANDPAIRALCDGDSAKAFEIWEAEESDPATGFVANHNIAVLLHLVALDWTLYQLNAEVDSDREQKIRDCWRNSFDRWEKVPSDDRLWDAVKRRILSVNDPRLTTGFGLRLADTLPIALDKINAEAGLNFAEQGQLEWARAHMAFMRETHQGLDDVEDTAEMLFAPIQKRILQRIKTALETTKKDPEKGGEAAKLLAEECKRMHLLYDLFFAKDAHQKTELFDEVAAASVDCLTEYHASAGGNRNNIGELLFSIAPFATAPQIQKRILYLRLRIIRESKESSLIQLGELKRQMVPHLASLAESYGLASELTLDFADALARALRGVSIDAHNDEDDFTTAVESIRLAVRLARSADLKKQCQDDVVVVEQHFEESLHGTR